LRPELEVLGGQPPIWDLYLESLGSHFPGCALRTSMQEHASEPGESPSSRPREGALAFDL
jgi:hypothetical protein